MQCEWQCWEQTSDEVKIERRSGERVMPSIRKENVKRGSVGNEAEMKLTFRNFRDLGFYSYLRGRSIRKRFGTV